MSLQVSVYDNGDHTALVWLPIDGQPIPECRGFAICRSCNGEEAYLHSFTGFSDGQKLPKDRWQWPVQRYMWWDYDVKPGTTVKYQVTPVVGSQDNLQRKEDLASAWTSEIEVTGQCTPHMSVYFNRGIVASQWVSRVLDQEAQGQNRQSALKELIEKPGDPLRDALSGQLRVAILNDLEQAKGGQLFAALYELNDPDLEKALKTMGASAHVILANGAFSAKEPDENAEARQRLRAAGVEVFDRMVGTGHFAHNKFAVFCDSKGNAQKVLTGSTNWTVTGLCTQANNGLIISDPKVAARFLQQWHLLKEAGNAFPPSLVQANSQMQQFEVDGVQVTPWFAPTKGQEDLNYARKLINGAQDGILFLFFNPGTYQEDPEKQTLLQCVLDRHNSQTASNYNPNLYIRGVVNQEIANLTNGGSTAAGASDGKTDGSSHGVRGSRIGAHPVALYNGSKEGPTTFNKDVLVPAAIKTRFHNWEDEALRASMVMVHSKVIVIDPFGKHPVLMTGSHNLGVKASSKNDDNLVILEGPSAAPLAVAYAINIIATYQTYRWNSHATDPSQAARWHNLQDNADWQQGHLTGDSLAELKFWLAQSPASHKAVTVGHVATNPSHAADHTASSTGKRNPIRRATN